MLLLLTTTGLGVPRTTMVVLGVSRTKPRCAQGLPKLHLVMLEGPYHVEN